MNALQLWQDQQQIAEVKKLFAPTLSDSEFSIFCGLGKTLELNPFTREIWAVKYGTTASIFVGRDGYRKNAQRHPQYDWHYEEAVYENDNFALTPNGVEHKFNLQNRGALVGAYALCKRKDSSRPNYIYVSLKEYNKKQSVWNTMPETMIKKVASAQVLRGTFQELFAGTYDEVEQGAVTGQKVIEQNEEENAVKEIEGLLETCTTHAKYLAQRDKIKKLIEKLSEGLQSEYLAKITGMLANLKTPKAEKVKVEQETIKEENVKEIFPQQ